MFAAAAAIARHVKATDQPVRERRDVTRAFGGLGDVAALPTAARGIGTLAGEAMA